jgi:hypothetical protein
MNHETVIVDGLVSVFCKQCRFVVADCLCDVNAKPSPETSLNPLSYSKETFKEKICNFIDINEQKILNKTFGPDVIEALTKILRDNNRLTALLEERAKELEDYKEKYICPLEEWECRKEINRLKSENKKLRDVIDGLKGGGK